MTSLERNIASLNANGWWVAVGPMQGGFVMAVAIREDALLTKRAGDTISEAVSILSRDLKDCPPTAAPEMEAELLQAGVKSAISLVSGSNLGENGEATQVVAGTPDAANTGRPLTQHTEVTGMRASHSLPYTISPSESRPVHQDSLMDAYFDAVDAALDEESRESALAGEFSPEALP